MVVCPSPGILNGRRPRRVEGVAAAAERSRSGGIAVALVVLLFVLSAFLTASVYADAEGHGRARQLNYAAFPRSPASGGADRVGDVL